MSLCITLRRVDISPTDKGLLQCCPDNVEGLFAFGGDLSNLGQDRAEDESNGKDLFAPPVLVLGGTRARFVVRIEKFVGLQLDEVANGDLPLFYRGPAGGHINA